MKLVAQYISAGEITENVFNYSTGAAPTVATMNNLIDAYIAWETAHGAHMRASTTGLQRVTATDLSTETAPVVDRQVLPEIDGLDTAAQAPNNVTLAFAVRTPLRGRSYRGRIYHIGMAQDMYVENLMVNTTLTAFVTAYSLLLSLGVAPIFHLGVLSRYHDKVRLDTCVWTQATAITANQQLDSQRRRLPGHNRHR